MTALAISHVQYYYLEYSYIQEIMETDLDLKRNVDQIRFYCNTEEVPLCDFKSFIFQDNIERKDTNINKYDLNQRESPVPENLGKLTIKKFQQKLKNAHV